MIKNKVSWKRYSNYQIFLETIYLKMLFCNNDQGRDKQKRVKFMANKVINDLFAGK